MSWLTNWNRRKQITVNGSTAGTISDYQMKLTVNQASGTDSAGIVNLGGDVLTTFNDLRFTKPDGTTLLNYWIESITGTTPNQTAAVWIKLAPSPDTIPTSPGTYSFYIYYNNISATTSTSNGTNTFQLFDDFSGASLDASKWIAYVGGNYYSGSSSSVGSGKMNLHIAGNCYACHGDAGFYSVNSFNSSNPIVIKYVSSPITKAFFGDWDQGHAWQGGFLLTANTGYPSSPSNNYLSVKDDYNGGFYISTYDTVTLRTLYSGSIGNITKNVVIKITSTNMIITVNDTEIYNGLHYLGVSDRHMYFERYADQRTWIDQNFDNIFIRKYISPEPTFSTISTEELGITATNMVINPSENPCRTSFCTIDVSVTWKNNNMTLTSFFTPAITASRGTVSTQSYQSLDPGASVTLPFTVSNITVGTCTICPNPN